MCNHLLTLFFVFIFVFVHTNITHNNITAAINGHMTLGIQVNQVNQVNKHILYIIKLSTAFM